MNSQSQLSKAMYTPTCGLPIGLAPSTLPVTRPPTGRLPVTPTRRYRTAP